MNAFFQPPAADELSEAWIDGDQTARWRSAPVHGPATGATASGSSRLQVEPGCRLPRHTDSAEETIVVVAGRARVTIGDDSAELGAGGIAVVGACVPHEVESTGEEPLRFLAVYASPNVVTTYEQDIQPAGRRERTPVA
jgi:mannose-6-phosphate isomerase-like protein (cupin superfamily)